MVKTFPAIFVTRTISAFDTNGRVFAGQTVQLNGTAGNCEASTTVRVVPEAAGLGATETAVYAKFAWASTGIDV